MAKISGNYEVVYIIDAALSEEATAALVEKFKTMAGPCPGHYRWHYPFHDRQQEPVIGGTSLC